MTFALAAFAARKRLFRYPYSYLIYSAAFDALPGPVKDYVFQRLWDVLSGKDTSKEFAHLSVADRRAILEILRAHLGCGTMRQRADGIWYFEVNNLADLLQNVIPFFERFGFLSAKKQRDFAKFIELAGLLRTGQHLTQQGVVEVLRIRLDMNDGGKRRYLDEVNPAHLADVVIDNNDFSRPRIVR